MPWPLVRHRNWWAGWTTMPKSPMYRRFSAPKSSAHYMMTVAAAAAAKNHDSCRGSSFLTRGSSICILSTIIFVCDFSCTSTFTTSEVLFLLFLQPICDRGSKTWSFLSHILLWCSVGFSWWPVSLLQSVRKQLFHASIAIQKCYCYIYYCEINRGAAHHHYKVFFSQNASSYLYC